MALETKLKQVLFSFAFCFVYAALDEIHQYYVPNRCASFFDFGIDSSGVLFGILFAFFIVDFFEKK